MKINLRHFLSLIALSGGLLAQQPPPQEESVSLQFRLMAWGTDIPELRYGNRQVVLPIEANTWSVAMDYSGPATLVFTKPPVDPQKPAPVAASLKLPLGVQKVTLFTAAAKGGRYGMFAIPDDPAGLPVKHARLYNFTSERLMIVYNKSERIELAPAASALVASSSDVLVVRLAAAVGEKWKELFNNVVPLEEKGGANVIFIRGQEGGGIGMFKVPAWPSDTPIQSRKDGV